jgi:hypothetical protein
MMTILWPFGIFYRFGMWQEKNLAALPRRTGYDITTPYAEAFS